MARKTLKFWRKSPKWYTYEHDIKKMTKQDIASYVVMIAKNAKEDRLLKLSFNRLAVIFNNINRRDAGRALSTFEVAANV